MRQLRLSIAGLMGVVLISAVGLAASTTCSNELAGVLFLMVASIHTLAIVGAACRTGVERAWWLGFALFGWGYLALAFLPRDVCFKEYSLLIFPRPATNAIFDFIERSLFGSPRGQPVLDSIGPWTFELSPFVKVCHELTSLVMALAGSRLAAFAFGRPNSTESPDRNTEAAVMTTVAKSVHWWRLAASGVMGFLILMLVGLPTGTWNKSGLVLSLTWAILGLLVVGAVCGVGRRRVATLGAALYGVGYMALIFQPATLVPNASFIAASNVLNAIRPWFPHPVREVYNSVSPSIAQANLRVYEALERPIPVRFPTATPLEDVIEAIRVATREADGRVLPIHIDPVGLLEAEKTLQSPVQFDVEGIPLRSSLTLALRPLGMTFGVDGGVLVITNEDSEHVPSSAYEDPFLVIGHCFFALLAAMLGSFLAPLVAGRQA